MSLLDIGADYETLVIMHLHGTQGSMFWIFKFDVDFDELWRMHLHVKQWGMSLIWSSKFGMYYEICSSAESDKAYFQLEISTLVFLKY